MNLRKFILVILISFFIVVVYKKIKFDITKNERSINGQSFELVEDEFHDVIGEKVFINSGITIERVNTHYGAEGGVGFLVSNNLSDESVTFLDGSFGLEVYYLDHHSNEWKKIEFIYDEIISSQVTIPPLSNKLAEGNLYFYYLEFRHLENLESEEIRLYISGIGNDTGNKFGAYTDVEPRIP